MHSLNQQIYIQKPSVLLERLQQFLKEARTQELITKVQKICNFKNQANSHNWANHLISVEETLCEFIAKFQDAVELTQFCISALSTIQPLYDRNLELLQKCECKDKQILDLKQLNSEIVRNMQQQANQAQLKIQRLSEEVEQTMQQKFELQQVTAVQEEEKTSYFGKLLQKERILREYYEAKVQQQETYISELKQTNYDLQSQIYILQRQIKADIGKQAHQDKEDEQVFQMSQMGTAKTIVISEISHEEDSMNSYEEELRWDQPVSLSSELDQYQQDNKPFNQYDTKKSVYKIKLKKKYSEGRLSTASSQGSNRSMKPDYHVYEEKLKFSHSQSHLMLSQPQQKQEMMSMLTSHLTLQNLVKTCSGISSIFSQDSRLSKIHGFLHKTIIDKKLDKFKGKHKSKRY